MIKKNGNDKQASLIKVPAKFYYGWVVSFSCILLIFVSVGVCSNCFSVFSPFLISDIGLTNTQASSQVTIRNITCFIAMAVSIVYYSKIGLRLGTTLGVCCAAVAYFLFSMADNYLEFCIGSVFAGICTGFGNMIPISMLMNNWFRKKLGFVLGLSGIGSSIAITVLPGIITAWIQNAGLHMAFRYTSILIAIIALVMFLLMRNKPSDMGLKPYGYDEVEATEKANTGSSNINSKYDKLFCGMRPITMIMLLVGSTILGAFSYTEFVHTSVLFASEGFSSALIAIGISVAGFVMAFFKIICGHVSDKIGGLKATILFSIILAISAWVSCLAYTGNNSIMFISYIIGGIGYPICTVVPSIWPSDLGRREYYGLLVQRIQMVYGIGGIAMSTVPGIMADATGSYIPSFILMGFMPVVAIVLLIIAYRTKRK